MTGWNRLDRILKWIHEHDVEFFLLMVAALAVATFYGF